MIRIAPALSINEDELQFEFVRASGPGGQNVNKVATAVQLRFDVIHSPSLPDDIRTRLIRLAGNRMTNDGVLLIEAKRFRTQARNRQCAREQLIDLIREASIIPKARRATKPKPASKRQRLEIKRRRSNLKQLRQSIGPDSE